MWRLLAAAACLLVACGPPGGDVDAGDTDGATDLDAGGDAGAAQDGGTEDAGADGGVQDAGADAGASCEARDAGPPSDAGWDAGPPCTANGLPGSCLDVSECVDTRAPTAGLCAGPANIQCCTPRYAVACDPNARPEPNACLAEAPGDGGCPSGMNRVATFCVDRYEGSLEEVLDGGAARPWPPFFNPGTRRVRARSLAGAVPQGYLSQLQATAACAEAGKRLCTDAEWLRACQGPAGFTYPYGTARRPGVCNDARAVHPAVELYGSSARWIFSHLDSPCLNQLPASLDRAGANGGCVTAEGVFDMMGNLHEWTADPTGTFRGGFYMDTVLNGNGCLYATTAHATTYWDYSTGFRCCSN